MNYVITMCMGSEIFFCDNSIYLDGISISAKISSFATGLVFEPMESCTQIRQSRKELVYVYISNLEVLDLIEHISLLD